MDKVTGLKIELIQFTSKEFIFVISFFLNKHKHSLSGDCKSLDEGYTVATKYLEEQIKRSE